MSESQKENAQHEETNIFNDKIINDNNLKHSEVLSRRNSKIS